ncbi:MAG: hypothetical protein KC478_12415 [Bacteriovoracaceae bacterium]|nr:hypothetical protein [Bacteriovoracaceae bacterium]
MKTITFTVLAIFLGSFSAFGNEVVSFEEIKNSRTMKAHFPEINIADAMGGTSISIEYFCMSEDQKTLKSMYPIVTCAASEHLGRGYKACSEESSAYVTVPNSYTTYRCVFPGCSQRIATEHSYNKVIQVPVRKSHPRYPNGPRLFEKEYEIPTCN